MADEISIRSRAVLEGLLAEEPPVWAQTIAARLALRVLPLAATGAPTLPARDQWALAMFRAAFVSWTARNYPAHDMRSTAEDASRVVTAVLDIMGASASTAAAARVVIQAAVTTTVSNNTTFNSAAIAADLAAGASSAIASSEGAAQLWESVSSDMSYLSKLRDPDRAETARRLMGEPLWLTDVRGDPEFQANFPPWIRAPFDSMTMDTELIQAGFGHWIEWYRAILPNTRKARPTSYFGETIDIRIASQPDTWWAREPKEVNDDIAGWLAGRAPETPADQRGGLEGISPLESLESIPQSSTIEAPGPAVARKRRRKTTRNSSASAEDVSIRGEPEALEDKKNSDPHPDPSLELQVTPPTPPQPPEMSAVNQLPR